VIDRRAARWCARLCRIFEGDYNYPPGLLMQAAEIIDGLVDELEAVAQSKGTTDEMPTVRRRDDPESGT
jgi:hypothetical protein